MSSLKEHFFKHHHDRLSEQEKRSLAFIPEQDRHRLLQQHLDRLDDRQFYVLDILVPRQHSSSAAREQLVEHLERLKSSKYPKLVYHIAVQNTCRQNDLFNLLTVVQFKPKQKADTNCHTWLHNNGFQELFKRIHAVAAKPFAYLCLSESLKLFNAHCNRTGCILDTYPIDELFAATAATLSNTTSAPTAAAVSPPPIPLSTTAAAAATASRPFAAPGSSGGGGSGGGGKTNGDASVAGIGMPTERQKDATSSDIAGGAAILSPSSSSSSSSTKDQKKKHHDYLLFTSFMHYGQCQKPFIDIYCHETHQPAGADLVHHIVLDEHTNKHKDIHFVVSHRNSHHQSSQQQQQQQNNTIKTKKKKSPVKKRKRTSLSSSSLTAKTKRKKPPTTTVNDDDNDDDDDNNAKNAEYFSCDSCSSSSVSVSVSSASASSDEEPEKKEQNKKHKRTKKIPSRTKNTTSNIINNNSSGDTNVV